MGQLEQQLKRITVSLCLCILVMVGEDTRLTAQDGCPPATCPNGSHSVCHKECDPNVSPICSPECVCTCEPTQEENSLQANHKKQAGEPALAQNDCQDRKPVLDELLTTQLWHQ
jgi:hypothetical protein